MKWRKIPCPCLESNPSRTAYTDWPIGASRQTLQISIKAQWNHQHILNGNYSNARSYIVTGTSSSDVWSFGNSFHKNKRSDTKCMDATRVNPNFQPWIPCTPRKCRQPEEETVIHGRSNSHFTKMRLVLNEVMTSQGRRAVSEMKMFEQRSVAENLRS